MTQPTIRPPTDGSDARSSASDAPGGSSPDTFILLTVLLLARLLIDGGQSLDWVVAALALIVGVAAFRHRRAVAALEAGRRAEAESFARILSGLSRSVSADAIVDAIVEELANTAGADHIVVVRRRPEAKALEATLISARPGVPPSTTLLSSSGLDDPFVRPTRRPVSLHARPGSGTAASSMDNEAAQAVADRIAEQTRNAYGLTHMLAAPLRVGGRGDRRDRPLAARRPSRGPRSTRRLLNGAALEASAALSRADSHRAAEAQASTDALTGLPNRRYFDEFCGLLARRRRAEDAVGVLMVDIDRFKVLNDRLRPRGRRRGPQGGRRARSSGRSATTTSRRATAARSSSSCCATRRERVALEVGERVRESVAALDLVGSRHPGGHACRSAWPSPTASTSRSTSSSTTPTRRSTGPSARAATGWSPRSVAGPVSPRRRSRYHRAVTHDPLDDGPAGDDGPGGDPPTLTNGDLARIFHEIGDMLEVKGELVFKTVAYHRAADAIGRSPVDLVAAYRSGTPPRIPGVGAAISDKIAELATTGHLAFYERLRAEIPPGLVALLQIPGLGPKTVRQLHLELGIESIEDLRAAAEAGRLRDLRGLSEKTEALVLEGIARLEIDAGPDAPRPGRDDHRGRHGGHRRHARRPSASSPPGRSAAGARPSATSTSSPRPTTPGA